MKIENVLSISTRALAQQITVQDSIVFSSISIHRMLLSAKQDGKGLQHI
jgi:hypothetical protein